MRALTLTIAAVLLSFGPAFADAGCVDVRIQNPAIASEKAQTYFVTVKGDGVTSTNLRTCADGAEVKEGPDWGAIQVAQSGGKGIISLPERALVLWYGNSARQCWKGEFSPGTTKVVLKETACPDAGKKK